MGEYTASMKPGDLVRYFNLPKNDGILDFPRTLIEIPAPIPRLTVDEQREVMAAEFQRASRTPFGKMVRARYGSRIALRMEH